MISFRKATEADFDGFFRLRCQNTNISWTGHVCAPLRDNLAVWYCAQLASPLRTIYLLEDDGMVAGYLYADIHSSEVVEIGYGIDEDRAGRGLGTLMISEFIDLASSMGFRQIFALIAETNLASQKCVSRNGFALGAFAEVRQLPLLTGDTKFYKWQLDL